MPARTSRQSTGPQCLRGVATSARRLAILTFALMAIPVPVEAQELPGIDPVWLHLYVRDRRLAAAAEAGTQHLAQGRVSDAVAQWQYVLDQPFDAWIPAAGNSLRSLRQDTWQRLENGSPAVIEAYLRIFGPDAKQELARARQADHSAAYLMVVRRFFITPEGYAAAEWLVKHWLDDGDWRRAAALAARVCQSRHHQQRLSPWFIQMALLSCELGGWEPEIQEIQRLAQRVKTGDRSRTVAPPVIGEGAYQPGELASSPPVLAADWTTPLESSNTFPQLDRILSEWTTLQREQDQPTAIGWQPVVTGQSLIFRDLETIRAVHLKTGATQWRLRTSLGLRELLSPAHQEAGQRRYRGAMWDAAAANSLVSGLSTDGRRVYGVDATESLTLAGIYGLESGQAPTFSRRTAARNRLLAIDLTATETEPRILWSTSDSTEAGGFSGHAFLGPPLAVGGAVYAISEHDRELCVTAFQAATGRLLWQQPLAEAERSMIEDRGRSTRACTPVVAKDLLICPTHIGLLVAVDLVTGELRWSHNSLENSIDASAQRFRTAATLIQRRHGAFSNMPLVANGSVVYLPSQSEKLYILDELTGEVRRTMNNPQAEYLACLHNDTVVTIGAAWAKCFSLESGEELWNCSFPGVISGHGLEVPGGYLVPLETGQIWNIDLKTGRSRGFRFNSQPQPVGHLVATDDCIISVSSSGLAAFPQTETVLHRLGQAVTHERDVDTIIRVANVHLVEGDLTTAVKILEAGWQKFPADPLRPIVRKMLWESYFQLVRDDIDRIDHWMAKLEALTERSSPAEQVRWLVALSARLAQLKQYDALTTPFEQLAQASDVPQMVECPTDRDLEVSAVVWMQILLSEIGENPVADDLRQDLLQLAETAPLSAAARTAERILDPQLTTQLRWNQALASQQAEQFQRAAILLRRWQEKSDSVTIDRGEQQLAHLLAQADLPTAAGMALDRAIQHSSVKERDRLLTEGWHSAADGELARTAWMRRQPVAVPVEYVRVKSQPRQFLNASDRVTVKGMPPQHEPYEDYQRPVTVVSQDSPMEWLLRNTERGTEVGVFDRTSSRKLFEVVLPFGASPPGALANLSLGTLVPFSLPGEIRALSPLEGRNNYTAWTLKLPEWNDRSAQALCGPATSRYALFQWKNVLLAVDPADGRLLWRRNDVEASGGMYADPRIGLLADDEAIFILGADKSRYQLLNAVNGQVLRKGTLHQDARFTRFDLGFAILHINDENEQRRIRIWDPKSNSLLLDDPLRSRQLFWRLGEDQVAWLSNNQHLRVYSVGQRKMTVDIDLSAEDLTSAGQLRGFEQAGRYFLSIGRNQPMATTIHFHMLIQDKLIPDSQLKDDLIAVTEDGRGILWRKTIPHRSFFQFGQTPVPFLVAGATVRDKRDPNRRWLRIEAIDFKTGLLLGEGDHLPNDRLLHADYDAISGHLRLLGRHTEIDLDFSDRAQRLAPREDPL